MLTSTALLSLKNHIKNSIAYAKYKVDDTYYTADISDAHIMEDERVSITFVIDHEMQGNITITEVQLYDHQDRLWASKSENITRRTVQEGILYRFAFTLTES